MITISLANRVRYINAQFSNHYMYTCGTWVVEKTETHFTREYGGPPGNNVKDQHHNSAVNHMMAKGALVYSSGKLGPHYNGSQYFTDYNGATLFSVGGSYWEPTNQAWPINGRNTINYGRLGWTVSLSISYLGDDTVKVVAVCSRDDGRKRVYPKRIQKTVKFDGYGIKTFSITFDEYRYSGNKVWYYSTWSQDLRVTLSSWRGAAAPDGAMIDGLAAFGKEVKPMWYFADVSLSLANHLDGDRATLITDALTKLKYVDINSLAFYHDTRNLVNDNRKLLRTLKKLKNPKEWANLWLSYRYGLRLYIHDASEIGQAIVKAYRNPKSTPFVGAKVKDSETGVLTGVTVTRECHIKVYISKVNTALQAAANALRKFDLHPSLVNLWDFVPYSFVVDWVIPIGDVFARLDAMIDAAVYPITGGVASTKGVLQLNNLPSFIGTVTFSQYKRWLETQSSLSRFSAIAGLSFGGGLCNIKHGVDTLCLAAQRKRENQNRRNNV